MKYPRSADLIKVEAYVECGVLEYIFYKTGSKIFIISPLLFLITVISLATEDFNKCFGV